MAEYEQMLQKKHALLNRVEGATSEVERQHLRRVSSHRHIAATLLPIRSVGVQVNKKFAISMFLLIKLALHWDTLFLFSSMLGYILKSKMCDPV